MPDNLVEGQIYIVENGTLKLIGVAPATASTEDAGGGDGDDDSGDGTPPGNGGPH
jgi:hypothetical protein